MEEKNGDAKAFWKELEDGGKVDLIFEHVQSILQSLKQKIKDGSATYQEYTQAMILVNEAKSNSLLQIKDGALERDKEPRSEETASPVFNEESGPQMPSPLTTEDKAKSAAVPGVCTSEEKKSPLYLPYQSHNCHKCLTKRPLISFKGENPLKIPILCHFQRRHAKTNSHSAILHVIYKTPCRRSLRNFQEVQRYLREIDCNFLSIDQFSFNTYVQLNRSILNPDAIVSDFDVSKGAESVPISFCNEIDSRRLPHFKYRKSTWPRGYYLNNFSGAFTDSCDCSEGCTDISKCACLQLTARGRPEGSPFSNKMEPPGYRYKRLQRPVPTGVFECSLLCKCSRWTCQNRVVQHGLQVRLQVFNAEKKGWGVRCLDDIDKGTFVCTYSGRLLSRACLEKSSCAQQDDSLKSNSSMPLSKQRKIEVACSDSEGKFVKTRKDISGNTENQECLLPTNGDPEDRVKDLKYGYNPRNRSHPGIRRPQSKTAILQSHRKKLGLAVLEFSVSSEEEEEGGRVGGTHSIKIKLSPKTEKKPSSDSVEGFKDDLLSKSNVVDASSLKEETPVENVCEQVTEIVEDQEDQDEKNLESPNPGAFGSEKFPSETQKDFLKTFNKEGTYLLDATKEGNIGRFLNHSCCPNLFVQNVFVETHDRNFPWVAFFTNRHVKAGTELTWDYGYEAGSTPEREVPCLCGFQKSSTHPRDDCTQLIPDRSVRRTVFEHMGKYNRIKSHIPWPQETYQSNGGYGRRSRF
ncbi:histone-lysine N-methyltransferase SETDB2 isoform X2 [Ornithorhynchus anatinus]|uniref:histone-lysine N-methyltransferase SETDB2 isoform X2 n=1 Tax=Ornithorhynchus anatinus TaxID=9258 RepID=UPI0007AA7A29|nr:histone-lysine N-methyltransferase SETDB2 isoform X2 [Ornithorhynchus anatinus]